MPPTSRSWNNIVLSETPEERVVLVDSTPRQLQSHTEVDLLEDNLTGTPVAVRELRSRRIEVREVRRRPLPNLSPTLTREGRELHEHLTLRSIREAQSRAADPRWLLKVDFERYFLAFPPGLRDCDYLLEYHIEALHVTGLIDNLGPNTRFDPIGYLERSEPGRAYLQSITEDTALETHTQCPPIGAQWDTYLITYIYALQKTRLEEDTFEYADWPTWKFFCKGCFVERGTIVYPDGTICDCDHATTSTGTSVTDSSSDSSSSSSSVSSSSTPDRHLSFEHPGAPRNQQD